jgi:hypothetical protein
MKLRVIAIYVDQANLKNIDTVMYDVMQTAEWREDYDYGSGAAGMWLQSNYADAFLFVD